MLSQSPNVLVVDKWKSNGSQKKCAGTLYLQVQQHETILRGG